MKWKLKIISFQINLVGEFEGRQIICKGGIKGQRVKVLLGKKKKDYTEGKINAEGFKEIL